MVEFALIVPLLLLLVLGTLDSGRAFSDYIALSDAAREGARYAALQNLESCSSAPSDPSAAVCATVRSHAMAIAPQVPAAGITAFEVLRGGGSDTTTDTQYTDWQVTIHYVFRPITSQVMGGLSIPITVNARYIAQ